ncbi:MAG TPA: cupin domain-containing protein [Burkholderiaceae bacterium]|nr:cupin domain-containing protein [Burkholderiaceae bacterium]
MNANDRASLPPRVQQLVERLQLRPHPEGGYYREFFRSAHHVTPDDGREPRSAITSIDFVLARRQHSAWHRVSSDEAWHLLEGGPLRLWLLSPSFDALSHVDLGALGEGELVPRHVVPGHWWQAAELLGDYAYVGATVAPGFEFADFGFLRTEAAGVLALRRLAPDLLRML